uniref:Uncharacterized protein n=1 Tax=Arundo donax TaxID=35708 RepID=A0A0A9CC06_ARUDO
MSLNFDCSTQLSSLSSPRRLTQHK